MRSGSLEKLFGNEEEMQSQFSPEEIAARNEVCKPTATSVYSPSNHSSNHSMLSDNISHMSHMSISSSPVNLTSFEQNVAIKNETSKFNFVLNYPNVDLDRKQPTSQSCKLSVRCKFMVFYRISEQKEQIF